MSSTSEDVSPPSPRRAPQGILLSRSAISNSSQATSIHPFLACVSCRKQKRKCDKALPVCTLCNRMGRPCDYSDASTLPSSEDFTFLRQKVRELERRLDRSAQSQNANTGVPSDGVLSWPPTLSTSDNPGQKQSSFPNVFFLDSEAFDYARLIVPRPSAPIPADVLAMLGTGSDIQSMMGSKRRMVCGSLNTIADACQRTS